MTSDVMFLTHEPTAPGKFMSFERWSNTLASPRNWLELMQSVRRELNGTLRLVVCTNLNLAMRPPEMMWQQRRSLRACLHTLGETARDQRIPVLAGMPVEPEELNLLAVFLRKYVIRFDNVVVEEIS